MIKQTINLIGHTHCVYSVAFSPDGQFLASGSLDKTVRIWDLQRNRQLYRFQEPTDSVRIVGWLNSQLLYAASFDRCIRIYKPFQGTLERILFDADKISKVEANFEGRYLSSLTVSGILTIWSSSNWHKIANYKNQQHLTVFCCSKKSLSFYLCTKTGQLIHILFDEDLFEENIANFQNSVNLLVLNNDESILAIGDDEGMIFICNVSPFAIIRKLAGHQGWVLAGSFSLDGRLFVSGGEDTQIHIHDIKSGKYIEKKEAHLNWIAAIAWFGSDKFVSCGQDNSIRCFEVKLKK